MNRKDDSRTQKELQWVGSQVCEPGHQGDMTMCSRVTESPKNKKKGRKMPT